LDDITFLFVTSADAEVIRFQAGDTDIINRLSAADASVLEGNQSIHLDDLGPSLEYNFLFFNLNATVPAQSGEINRKQNWFRQLKFRQAVSLAIDRDGITRLVVPLEFRAVLDRVFQTHDYEAAVLALGGGDVDPNSQMNVWLSSGSDHLWKIGQPHPATTWEAEIDQLMEKQLSTLKPEARKLLYNRVQEIFAENVPLICLVSPNILVGAKNQVGNFKPATLDPHTLWNAQELFLVGKGSTERP
jgi:ABC-type transport system substrate-binding protein